MVNEDIKVDVKDGGGKRSIMVYVKGCVSNDGRKSSLTSISYDIITYDLKPKVVKVYVKVHVKDISRKLLVKQW